MFSGFNTARKAVRFKLRQLEFASDPRLINAAYENATRQNDLTSTFVFDLVLSTSIIQVSIIRSYASTSKSMVSMSVSVNLMILNNSTCQDIVSMKKLCFT